MPYANRPANNGPYSGPSVTPSFALKLSQGTLTTIAPHWFLVMIVGTLAAAPWLPFWSKQFSLRTLLIAMTVLAILLGAIIYAVRLALHSPG